MGKTTDSDHFLTGERMASPDIIKKAIDALTVANVAVTNIRLYPPTSAIIRNTVDRAYQIFSDILTEQDSVIFAESGHNFIISYNFV